jgi:uncharacterized pyridoxamine 5'-phosphate oxidase family protein
MSKYEEGLKLVEEKFGNYKDNVVSIATIAEEPGTEGKPRPVVRDVDAYYEGGTFYITTNAKSRKMKQIEKNSEIAFSVCNDWFNGVGTGENLGWVLDPQNTEIRLKLRKAFSNWYDMANNEKDENCCIMAIHITKGTLNVNHWEKLYHLDFVNKAEMENWGVF